MRKLRRAFGTSDMSGGQEESQDPLIALQQLIARRVPVNITDSLLGATQGGVAVSDTLDGAAVCLDTNIFFRLAAMPERANVVDFLASQYRGSLIVSAQAMQEVWNNYLNGIDTIAEDLRKKINSLDDVVSSLDDSFKDYRERFKELLDEFKGEFGHLHTEGMRERVRGLIEVLKSRAMYSEVPRTLFEPYYSVRKITKTPPGFKDGGAGDYYIWLDFLYGLKAAKNQGNAFSRAILVSDDRKKDWVKGSAPHPTLSAECMQYVGVPLEVWSLRQLVRATN